MESPTAGQVATLVARTATIGAAYDALRREGWQSAIAGNRITVEDSVFARYIDDSVGMQSGASPRWVVYGISDRTTVLVVGASVATG